MQLLDRNRYPWECPDHGLPAGDLDLRCPSPPEAETEEKTFVQTEPRSVFSENTAHRSSEATDLPAPHTRIASEAISGLR